MLSCLVSWQPFIHFSTGEAQIPHRSVCVCVCVCVWSRAAPASTIVVLEHCHLVVLRHNRRTCITLQLYCMLFTIVFHKYSIRSSSEWLLYQLIFALKVTFTLSLLISYHQQHHGNDTGGVDSDNALVVNTKMCCIWKELSVSGFKLLQPCVLLNAVEVPTYQN